MDQVYCFSLCFIELFHEYYSIYDHRRRCTRDPCSSFFDDDVDDDDDDDSNDDD